MLNQTIQHYKILEKLGEGGMGVVYKARDTKLDREVALKFLPSKTVSSQEEKARFEQEAKAAAKLSHANIAHVYEINEHEGETFIAMEYLDGETLADRIERGPLKLDIAIEIGMQMAAGLQAAHEKDITHRDIKSQNIMVTAKGVVKIMDFGLAKMGGLTKLTQEGTTLGTVAYMSPEQTRGDEVDQRSDIFSLCVLFYEMLTTQLPFKGDYEQAVVYAILNEDPEPITGLRSGIPIELERIVFKGMAKDPAERYQNVTDLLVDLRAVQKASESEGGGASHRAPVVPSGPATAEPDPAKPTRKFTPVIVGLAALAILVAFLGTQFGWFNSLSSSDSVPPSADKMGIAILPFDNLSQDSGDEYFADGMTDELISRLSQIDAFRVIARTSVMQYKGQSKDVSEIGAELNVDKVVEGTVRKAGQDLRITVQLVNVATQAPIWSTRYDRKFDDVFAIQDEISQALLDKLQVTLLEDEKSHFAKHGTDNLAAYNLYLQGRFLWNKRTKQDLLASIDHFESAVELDPSYALAYSGLADAYIILGFWGHSPPREMYPLASAAAHKALQLDENQAEAITSLAFINAVYEWNWLAAERGFRQAIELKPSYAIAHQWFSEYLIIQDRFDEAIAEITVAQSLDPLSQIITSVKGEYYRFIGEYEKALAQYNKVLALNPDFGISYFHRGVYYGVQEEYELALADIRKALELTGGAPIVKAFEGMIYAVQGDKGKAREVLNELLKRGRDVGALPIFILYYELDDLDDAMDWFEKAYEERDSNIWMVWRSGGFDQIESNPRFQKLLKEVGLND